MGAAREDDAGDRDRVPVGISSCLLGEKVRYDGGHRQAALVIAELTPHVRWVPVCPEMEVGMGVPREPVHLVEGDVLEHTGEVNEDAVRAGPRRMLGVESGRDWTERMESFAAACAARLEELEVSGYIFKARSPSCGLKEVPIHAGDHVPIGQGPGLFAAAVRARFPALPVAEESDLADAAACRAFLERARQYRRRRTSRLFASED